MPTFAGTGEQKRLPGVDRGLIIAFTGPRIPTGWALCDGTLGTPDLRGAMVVGATAAGTGTAGGTADTSVGLVHAGFALGAHSNHVPTQPGAHTAHSVTQPSTHSNHAPTQSAVHPTHASGGAHTHDTHVLGATGSLAVAGVKLVGPAAAHSSDGAHTHDAHPAHAGWGVDVHSAHAGFAVDAHNAHSGFAVDAHDAHGVTQADTHLYKVFVVAYVMKL